MTVWATKRQALHALQCKQKARGVAVAVIRLLDGAGLPCPVTSSPEANEMSSMVHVPGLPRQRLADGNHVFDVGEAAASEEQDGATTARGDALLKRDLL